MDRKVRMGWGTKSAVTSDQIVSLCGIFLLWPLLISGRQWIIRRLDGDFDCSAVCG